MYFVNVFHFFTTLEGFQTFFEIFASSKLEVWVGADLLESKFNFQTHVRNKKKLTSLIHQNSTASGLPHTFSVTLFREKRFTFKREINPPLQKMKIPLIKRTAVFRLIFSVYFSLKCFFQNLKISIFLIEGLYLILNRGRELFRVRSY